MSLLFQKKDQETNKQINRPKKRKTSRTRRKQRGKGGGGWGGKRRREEVSLPLSHHTPRATRDDWGRVSHSIALIEGIEKNERMFNDYCLTDR